ncbi:energy transducer TonB [Flavobacterium sp. ARAG 55.4]|uniref:energy transducer TonB n=1 Tax=Flavobacterium sp. ARAG 55.4 TaxID=3451357 RepID=UPI003F454825
MSQHSLYESNWINLVFENRNKEYGAFQLRQQTTRTSFNALFIGVLVCATLIILPNLLLHPKHIEADTTTDWTETIIQLQDIYQAEEQAPAAPALPEIQQQAPTEAIETRQLIDPIVVSTSEAPADVEYTLEKSNPIDTTKDGVNATGLSAGTGEGVLNGSSEGAGIGTGTSNSNGNELIINEVLDKKPQFPGGIEKFYRYVGNNFRSPMLDETKNVRIFVSFVVEKDGSMSNIKVLNKPGQGLEKEAIRVLQSIKTKWSPGILNAKPVRTTYNLPIVVQIN